MIPFFMRPVFRPRIVVGTLWGAVCLGIVGAPLLAALSHSTASGLLYLCFAPVCHQMPDRSFALCGHAWAVCHRCSGIYIGLFAASLLPLFPLHALETPGPRRLLALWATLPLLLDAILPAAGLWESTPSTRFVTGLLFGGMLGTLLVAGVSEVVRSHFRKQNPMQAPEAIGGMP